MKSYKKIILFIISLSSLSVFGNNSLEEYKIELIVFKHNQIQSDESFDAKLNIPNSELLGFYSPALSINSTSLFKKNKEKSFFTSMFENFKPKRVRESQEKSEAIRAPNPGNWFRKSSSLSQLKKLNTKLINSSNYNVLDSYSWVQNIEDKESSNYLADINIDKKYGYYLKFYKTRFLHADLKAYIGIAEKSELKDITRVHIENYENKIITNNNNKISTIPSVEIKLNKKNTFKEIKTLNPKKEGIKGFDEIKIFIDEERRIFNEEIHYFDHPYFGVIISINKI